MRKLNRLLAVAAFTVAAWFGTDLNNAASAQVLNRAFTTTQPTNPTITASATKVMMGLGVAGAGGGWSITPVASGFIQADISGLLTQTTTADGATFELDFGPTAVVPAPANGAAAPSGTVVCTNPVTWTALTGALAVPFHASCFVQVTPGQAWWFDIGLLRVTGGSAGTIQLTGFLKELN